MVWQLCSEVAEYAERVGSPRENVGGMTDCDGSGHKQGCWAGGMIETHPRPIAVNCPMLGFGPWGTAPTIWLNCQGKRFMNEAMSGLALVQSLHQPMPELGKTANFAVMDANYMKYIQLAGLDHGAPNWGYQEGMDLFESDMQALDPAVGSGDVTGLEIDTEYDLEVRFSAAGENFVAAKSFRTTKELLIDGGFDELPDFLSVSASLYKNVVDCNDCPWSGTGEVANRARASGGNISPSTTYAKDLITSNVYAFIWKDKDLKQSITVPANGTYKVSFKYAASPNFSQDHSTAVEVVSEGGVTNTLFVESIENGDYTLHQCEREVTLPAGNMTFQLRGIPPDGIAVATCYDDISLQLVEANVNPALSLSTSGEGIDRVTLDLNLSALGAPDAIVDIAIAFAPTNQTIGDYYEPILSGLSAPGIYTATIAGLDMNVTYACRLRVRNNSGGEAFVNGTFSTPASIIGNGGFEEGSSIASGNVGDLYDNNGVWPATTTVWKVNAVKAVYNNGISKPNTYFTPNANFTLGGYSGFIWKEGSFEQDIIVPLTGRYRLGFRYGLASNYNQSINIEVNIAQNGVTNTVWSINNVTAKTTQFVPDNTIANLVQGPATFTIKQTINSTASTSGCYDDITLMPLAKEEWTNEVVVVSQNPAVTGGMKPAPQVYADPAAGWAQTFSADGTWTDPSTGDKYTCTGWGRKYTCTGWKLYRNGQIVDRQESLTCDYVHAEGADDSVVWGWKPWAPSDRILGGQGFFIRVF